MRNVIVTLLAGVALAATAGCSDDDSAGSSGAAAGLGDDQDGVTVYAVDFPVTAADDTARRIATDGTRFAVADVETCIADVDLHSFALVDTDSRAYGFWNVQVGARTPNFVDTYRSSGPDACTRGWLTFELTPGTEIVEVRYGNLVWPTKP